MDILSIDMSFMPNDPWNLGSTDLIASEAKRSELAREPPVTVWEKETTTYLENEAF